MNRYHYFLTIQTKSGIYNRTFDCDKKIVDNTGIEALQTFIKETVLETPDTQYAITLFVLLSEPAAPFPFITPLPSDTTVFENDVEYLLRLGDESGFVAMRYSADAKGFQDTNNNVWKHADILDLLQNCGKAIFKIEP